MQLAEVSRFADDVDATVSFFATLLGADPVSRWEGGAVFDLGGPTLLVHERYEPGPDDLPPEDHIAFDVEDVDAACATLSEQNLTVAREPADYDWGRSAYLEDPDGRLVELTARA